LLLIYSIINVNFVVIVTDLSAGLTTTRLIRLLWHVHMVMVCLMNI